MAEQHHQPRPDDGAAQDRYVGGQDLTRWRTPIGRAAVRIAQRISRQLGPHTALVLILLLGATAAVLLTALTGEVYESVVEADGVAMLDHPLLQAAMGLRSPGLDAAVTGFTNLAGTVGMPVLAGLAMLVLSLTRRSWMPVVLIATAGGGSLLMTLAGKHLTGRTRPPLADAVPPYEYSASFPSGHSLNSVVVAGIVAYVLVLRQHTLRARVLTVLAAAVFAVAVGLSRVFLGHHWFTDVLGAWTLGLAWLSLVITAHRLYLTVRHRGTQSRT
ncbi:phosphatase PAP2 family protein [Arthrobacter sp. GCM10027362]|uniref:phosphatase PAP2 family protein n=1 Tax=Arthrobacter sp. GCM10027362 TaxID=3273379 RepID=UPI0036335C51